MERLAGISGKTDQKNALFQRAPVKQAGMNDPETAMVRKTAEIDRIAVTIKAVEVVSGSSLPSLVFMRGGNAILFNFIVQRCQ